MNRTKYNVDKDKEKRTCNDKIFDSILEMKFYRDVVLPKLESGEIVSCELQVPFILQPKFVRNGKTVQPIKYVADFVITYSNGHEEIIDTKGMPDSVAKLKRKMFWYLFPELDYKWIGYVQKYGGWLEYETILEQRKLEKAKKKK